MGPKRPSTVDSRRTLTASSRANVSPLPDVRASSWPVSHQSPAGTQHWLCFRYARLIACYLSHFDANDRQAKTITPRLLGRSFNSMICGPRAVAVVAIWRRQIGRGKARGLERATGTKMLPPAICGLDCVADTGESILFLSVKSSREKVKTVGSRHSGCQFDLALIASCSLSSLSLNWHLDRQTNIWALVLSGWLSSAACNPSRRQKTCCLRNEMKFHHN